MPARCKNENCNKYASFNLPNEKSPIYCKEHKKDNMVITKKDNRVCCHPDHDSDEKPPRASFNFPHEKKPIYCQKHAEDGMINLNNKNNKCIVCKLKSPCYGLLGQKATHCSKCVDPNMIDVVSKTCDHEGCRKNPTYGFPGGKPTRCKPHATPDMIDVKNRKCKLCNKQPTFGLNNIATHCIEHKTEDMTDVKHIRELCIHPNCTKRPSYGVDKQPTHCKEHKTGEMKDLVSRMCQKCNLLQGVFGTSKDCLLCKNCKEPEMKNIKAKMCRKCNEKQPTYNYKGIKPPIYCVGCALDDMVDVINPMCKSCGLFVVPAKPHLCNYCSPKTTMRERTKEMLVVNHFKEIGYEFIHNKSVGFVCGNYRPDIKIDAGTHIVIVEIDEDQHSQYDKRCENARMLNIAQAEGLKCIFIRYNPDTFRVDNKIRKVHTTNRLKVLTDMVDKVTEDEPEEHITVYKLFYNNTSGDHVVEDESLKEHIIVLCDKVEDDDDPPEETDAEYKARFVFVEDDEVEE